MRIPLISAFVLTLLLAVPAVGADDTKPTTNTGLTEYNGKNLKQWVEEIDKDKNADPGLRHRAILAVTLFDPTLASKEAGPVLVEAVADFDTSIRVNALVALAVLGIPDALVPKALPTLISRMETDTQGIVRLHAALVIGKLDFAGRPALPALINRLRDTGSYEIRKQVVIAVARVGAADEKNPMDMRAVQELLSIINGGIGKPADRSAEVRLAAVSAIAEMGIPPTPKDKTYMVDGLKTASKRDPHKIIQIWSRVALMKLDGISEQEIGAILALLRGTDQLVRVEAIRALGVVGPKAMPACFDTMVELLKDKDIGLVANAAFAIGEWGESAEEALPKLQKAYDSKEMDDRLKPIIKDAIEKVQGKKPK